MDQFKLMRHDVIVQFTMRSLKTYKIETLKNVKPNNCLALTKAF